MKLFLVVLCSFIAASPALSEESKKVPKHYLTKIIKLGNSTNNVEIFIHYPKHRVEFAKKTADILKNDLPRIHEYFGYIPQSEVHVVINLKEQVANGAAGVFPRNTIYLHDFPPIGYETLSVSRDWVRILVIHEYVHILTLEMTTGVFDVARYLFGSFMKWAQFTPRWFAEGMAVWAESKFTKEGRLRHPLIRSQIKKVLFDEKACHDPLCWDRPWHYPSGQLSYWIGGMLFEYMENKQPGAVACIAKSYSGNLPIMLNDSFQDCFGKSVRKTFKEFRSKIMSQKKIPLEWCPFDNDYLCEKIYKKYRNIDWFRGYIDTDNISAFVIVPTYQGNFSARKEGELLVVYDKETSKFKKIFLDKPIDRIYRLKGTLKEDDFLISLFYRQGSGINRNVAREYKYFDSKKRKVRSLRRKSRLKDCHYLLSYRLKISYCLSYGNSRWTLSRYERNKKKTKRETIYQFPALERVEPIYIDKDTLTVQISSSYNQKGDKVTLPIRSLKRLEEEKPSKLKESKRYAGWRYLSPNYLMPFLFTGGNLTSLGLITGLNDPLDRHVANLTVFYNLGLDTDDSPYSGNASYFYNRNNWVNGGGYSKFISQSSSTEGLVNVFETTFLQSTHISSIKKNIVWEKSLLFSQNSEGDILNNRRKLKTLKFMSAFASQANSKSNLYQGFSLYLAPMQIQNFSENPYFGFESNFRLSLRPSDMTKLTLQGAYGKVDTDNLADGTIYGGGASDAFTGNFLYPSYLIPFTNIFGREMTQARLTFSWNFNNPYKFTDSINYYLRRLQLLAGVEYIKSDFLINPDAVDSSSVFVADPSISSYFFGLRTVSDILYIFPLNIDFVFSRSSNEVYDGSFRLLIAPFLTF